MLCLHSPAKVWVLPRFKSALAKNRCRVVQHGSLLWWCTGAQSPVSRLCSRSAVAPVLACCGSYCCPAVCTEGICLSWGNQGATPGWWGLPKSWAQQGSPAYPWKSEEHALVCCVEAARVCAGRGRCRNPRGCTSPVLVLLTVQENCGWMECHVSGMAWFQVGATCSSKPYFTTRLVDGLVQQSCAAGAVTWSGPLCCPGCTEQLTWPALDGDSHATRLWLWQAHAGRKANCQMVACVTVACTGWGIRAGASFLHVLAVFVPYSCRLLHACCAPHLLLGSHSVHVSWYASCGPWLAAHASLAWSTLLLASSRLETLGRTAAVLCAGHTAADRRASLLLDPWLWLLLGSSMSWKDWIRLCSIQYVWEACALALRLGPLLRHCTSTTLVGANSWGYGPALLLKSSTTKQPGGWTSLQEAARTRLWCASSAPWWYVVTSVQQLLAAPLVLIHSGGQHGLKFISTKAAAVIGV